MMMSSTTGNGCFNHADCAVEMLGSTDTMLDG